MSTAAEKRQIFLEQLDAYLAAGGDGAVPQLAMGIPIDGKPYPLGRRAEYMRTCYRKGQLPLDFVQALQDRPGWVWDVATARWHQRYQDLQAHLAAHDGAYTSLDPALNVWLNNQRKLAAAGKLTQDQAAKIRALPPRGGLPTFLGAAYAWLAKHPSATMADVTSETTVGSEHHQAYPLGRRTAYYQRRAAGTEGTHPLSPADRELLERLPGWSWG